MSRLVLPPNCTVPAAIAILTEARQKAREGHDTAALQEAAILFIIAAGQRRRAAAIATAEKRREGESE